MSEETVKALYKKIIGILIRQFKDQLSEEERHDVAVDSVSNFLRAVDQGNYDPNKAVSSYIKIIARNSGIKALDRQKRQIDLIDIDPEKTDVLELLGEIDDRVEYEDLLAVIEQKLQRYDQNQATRKNAFTDMTGLFDLILQGYTTKEIAAVYNITPEWTRQLKINLAQILKDILSPKTVSGQSRGRDPETGLYYSLSIADDVQWAVVCNSEEAGFGVASWHHYRDHAEWNAKIQGCRAVPVDRVNGKLIIPPLAERIIEDYLFTDDDEPEPWEVDTDYWKTVSG